MVLRVLGRRHTLRQRDHWTRQQLQAHQGRALQQLREYAYAHSPFYRCFHAGRTDRPLHELPVLPRPYPQPYAADCMRLTAASSLSDLLSHDS